MTRHRVNVGATVPDTGSVRSSANVIVTWDPATPLADIEESIKQAARDAIRRARVVARIQSGGMLSPDPSTPRQIAPAVPS